MNFIKKLILILIIFLFPLSAFADSSIDNDFSNKPAISTYKHFEKDLIKNDYNNLQINLLKTSESSISPYRRNFSSGILNKNLIFNQEKNYNFNDIYSGLFLDNKSKTLISLLLFQIQPNAP